MPYVLQTQLNSIDYGQQTSLTLYRHARQFLYYLQTNRPQGIHVEAVQSAASSDTADSTFLGPASVPDLPAVFAGRTDPDRRVRGGAPGGECLDAGRARRCTRASRSHPFAGRPFLVDDCGMGVHFHPDYCFMPRWVCGSSAAACRMWRLSRMAATCATRCSAPRE